MAYFTDKPEEARAVLGFPAQRAAIFESVSDFASWAIQAAPSAGASVTVEASDDWDYGVGFAGMLELARVGGWQEGADRMASLSLTLPEAESVDTVPKRARRVAGSRPHAGAAAAGSPRAMIRRVPTDQASTSAGVRVLRVVLPWGKSAHVEGDACERYGAALVECIDATEAAGIRCEVVLQQQTDTGTVARVTAKHAGEHVDRAALAFLIAHPAATRRLRFRAQEGPEGSWPCGSYGGPTTQPWARGERESGALVLPYMSPGFPRKVETMAEARAYVRALFEQHIARLAAEAAADPAAA
ncbi:MAG: hypothetical protein V2I24_09225 [Halieaceae bacterium]|jgi:hypothetical protein|nr:hypothetical protein [Halieaceae bacterium]